MKTTVALISEEDRKSLGEELIKWRMRNGRTQVDVAKAVGLSRWTISRIERDASMVDIATAYRVYSYLARQQRQELMALQQIDQYALERTVAAGKNKIDEQIIITGDDWRVDNGSDV